MKDDGEPLPTSMLNKLQSLSLKKGSLSAQEEDQEEGDAEVIPSQHRCPHCPKSFVSMQALDRHSAAKHKDSGDSAVGKISGMNYSLMTVSVSTCRPTYIYISFYLHS